MNQAAERALTRNMAIMAAEEFQALFPDDTYARWVIAGTIRRGRDRHTEIHHAVLPLPGAPCDDPMLATLGLRATRNPVWDRLDTLLAAGEVQLCLDPAAGRFLWEWHVRSVRRQGLLHRVFCGRPANFGVVLLVATGPTEFVAKAFGRMEDSGHRIGTELLPCSGERYDTEDKILRAAGMMVAPERR